MVLKVGEKLLTAGVKSQWQEPCFSIDSLDLKETMSAFCAEHTRGERESGEADAAEAAAGNGGDLPEAVSPTVFLRQVREAHVVLAQRLQPRHCLHAGQQRIHW